MSRVPLGTAWCDWGMGEDQAQDKRAERQRKRPPVVRGRPLSTDEVHGIIAGILGRAVPAEEVARYAHMGYMRRVKGSLRETAMEMLREGRAPTYRQVVARRASKSGAVMKRAASDAGISVDELRAEILRCIAYAWQSTGEGPEWKEIAEAIGVSREDVHVILRHMQHAEKTVFFTSEHRSLRLRDAEGNPVPPIPSAVSPERD